MGQVSRKVWSGQLRKNLDMKFLCFYTTHNYNHKMNDNDIADQLRLQYWMICFSRNNKWWWALWLWGYEACLVNAYMMYCRYHQIHNLPLKYNHYTFFKATAKAYINPLICWPICNQLHLNMIENRLAYPPRAVEKQQRCIQFTNRTLCPVTGALCCHCDETLHHFPKLVPKKKNPTQCQLHMQAFKSTARGKCKEEKSHKALAAGLVGVLCIRSITALTAMSYFIGLTICCMDQIKFLKIRAKFLALTVQKINLLQNY